MSVTLVTDFPQTNSHQQLMGEDSDGLETATVPSVSSVDSDRAKGLRTVTYTQWITVGILCYVNLINYMDRFTMAGIMKDIQGEFSLNGKELGLLQTVFVISFMVFAPIFGYLGDRYNRRYIMTFGIVLWSLTTLLGSFMNSYGSFLALRACVGIGEASYTTIAPTIISDLFVKDLRAKFLAVFYFAIPVGSGLGYIVGAKTAYLAGQWQWALRITPIMGTVAAILILFVMQEPERGESEGRSDLSPTSWLDDLRHLISNKSFMLSTAAFMCVSFVAGALAWWGPTFIKRAVSLQPGNEHITDDDVAMKFGIISMIAGVLGVGSGLVIASRMKVYYPEADPLVCAFGLLLSVPMVFFALVTSRYSVAGAFFLVFLAMTFLNLNCVAFSFGLIMMLSGILGVPLGSYLSQKIRPILRNSDPIICGLGLLLSAPLCLAALMIFSPHPLIAYTLIFFAELLLNLNWAIVADILLYVVVPTRRSTAEAFQILISHAFGDAGSPYLIGLAADSLTASMNSTMPVVLSQDEISYYSLQYSLYSTCFVEVIGGLFFLATAFFVVRDRMTAERSVKGISNQEPSNLFADEHQRNQLSSMT